MRRSRDQKVLSLIPPWASVLRRLISLGLYMFNVVCAVILAICRIALFI